MNKVQVDKEFENLVKYGASRGVTKCTDDDFNKLLDWSKKNDPIIKQMEKSTDYGYYAISFIIIFIIFIIFLMLYYSVEITTEALDGLIDEKNKNNYIDISEYDNEYIEDDN